jgi:spermidine synthase
VRRSVALATMIGSGFAGLGYQIVWTQQGALWLGHEAAAMLAVVAAFFGGLAAGSLALGTRIERSPNPLRWYAACELAIGAWSVVLAFALPRVSGSLLDAIGADAAPWRQWTLAFGGTFVVLLPATAAMGATLPAMERAIRNAGWQAATVAWLYAGNTAGAVVGVLAGALVLIPTLGLQATALCCATVNVVCAAIAWYVAREAPRQIPREAPRGLLGDAGLRSATPGGAAVLAVLATTGFLGVAYEVLVLRVVSQVAEDTVYTFALALAVYLVGTTVGAAIYARASRGAVAVATLRGPLLGVQALACLAGIGSLWGAQRTHDAVLALTGPGVAGSLAAEAVLAALAFVVPTIAMGALFSHLCAEALHERVPLGRALAVNTLGAALAPPLAGVVFAPLLGPKIALLLLVCGYLVLAVSALARRDPPASRPWALLAVAGGTSAVLALFAPALAFVDVPAGGRVLDYREGITAAVSVVEDSGGVARLRINNRQQEGSSGTLLADGRQALLPMLLHPAPHRALFLGLGTGVTAFTAAAERGVDVTAVELLPEVVDVSGRFTREFGADPRRPAIVAADARRFVRTSPDRWDVIVADNFHPARSGSGSLYTVEHFAAVRARLAPGGLFCQWLPLHQLDLPTLAIVVRSFLTAFPRATAVLATHSLDTPVLGLVGTAGDVPFDVDAIRRRVASYAGETPAAAFGFDDELSVVGSFVAGADALAAFASEATVNTDDRPIVAYRAPRVTYAPDTLPRERLAMLLDRLTPAMGSVIARMDSRDEARIAAYWVARTRFLRAGMNVRPTADPEAMLAQVQAPLLHVLRTSPEFRPAYDPLFRLAVALAGRDDARATELLEELERLQPARTEARDALLRLLASRAVTER